MNTDYLGLILTDASETNMTFLEWRTLMNGTQSDSNMQLIDGALSALNTAIGGKADGFTFSSETGVLQLTSGGVPIIGASVTINLNNYYTKEEVDELLSDLEDNLADNDTIQELRAAAIGDLEWDENSRALTLYNLNGEQIGDTITIEGGGGGGGGTSYSVRIINGLPASTFTTASSSPTSIKASFYEYYGTESTGVQGTLLVEYKRASDSAWTTLTTRTVSQGVQFTIDVTNILVTDAATSVRLTVTGGESEIARTLTYQITQVDASISTVNFDTTAVYTGNFDIQYQCVGRNLSKIVYFMIDGEEYRAVDVGTSHNTTLTQSINVVDELSYGAHDLQIYFVTADGAYSNILNYTILYNNGESTDPMIGLICDQTEVTYGDTINVTYIVYTPGQEVTDALSVRVYAIEEGEDGEDEEVVYSTSSLTNIANNTAFVWNGTNYPPSGTAYIEFASGNTTKTVTISIAEIQTDYNLEQVATNLVYKFSANGRSNNDSDRAEYVCNYTTSNGTTTHIKGVNSGFNWVSNGYVNGESLTISGEAAHTIKLPIFSTSYTDDEGQTVRLEAADNSTVTTNGRTIEIEYKVSNVTDINAVIAECMSAAHAGFKITPQTCYLLSSNGANVALDETGFIENEASIPCAYVKDGTRIRLAFVIEPRGSVSYTDTDGTAVRSQCVNIYINGQYANSCIYPDNALFTNTEFIKFGSDTCITDLYEVRIYNRGLSADEIMQNYQASPVSVADRIARFEDNDVLDDNGNVDYEKARCKYNCLLITGQLSPYKGADGIRMSGKTESGSTLTKPDGNGGYTTLFEFLDKDSYGNWVASNNVQGTSSVKFPVKNYKVYLARNTFDENGEVNGTTKVKFSLKGYPDPQMVTTGNSTYPSASAGTAYSIPESTLCWKGDYMSSDHANTFNANLADTIYQDTTVAQEADARVQNTVYGFRCLLFRRDDIGEPIEFIADGCLNNDKGNNKTFGLEVSGDDGNVTTRQKWEFLNNTEALCSFQTDRLQEEITTDGETTLRAVAGLESTYPDQGDLEDDGLTPNYDYIQVLFTWVCQRANFWDASDEPLSHAKVYNGNSYTTERAYRKAIFLNEFERHFDKNHTLIYYLFMEFVALCDNRAKNMFMQSLDVTAENLVFTDSSVTSLADIIDPSTGAVDADKIDWLNSTFAVWMPVLYDLDSCFGVENSGYLQIPYYADWNFQLNNTQKFNGAESRLWLMVEEALAGDIQSLAQTITSRQTGNGALNYDSLYQYHIENNAKLVCANVVNEDMDKKYTAPWVEGFVDYSQEGNPVRHISDYKYLQRGSRTEQKDAFIYRRCNMLYSKYRCNKFLNNNINFRCGTNGGVPATNSTITVKSSQVLYPAVKFGDGDAAVVSGAKTPAGTACSITKAGTSTTDKVGFSDTVYIAGGTLLTDIGDISKFHPYELQLQNATSLRRLIIGSDEEGYENSSLQNIDTSACKILEELNVEGCTSLGNIDLSRNGLIREIYAANSNINSIALPVGGVLETLELGSPADITIINHTALETFSCTSYSNLTSLRVENTPNIDTLEIVAARLPYLTGGLRLVGIDETLTDTSVLEMLLSDNAKGKYVDNNGVLLEDANAYPYISGTIHCATIGTNIKNQLAVAYPNLVIDAGTVITQYVVSFYNYDDTLLDRQYILQGGTAVDPTTRLVNPISTPTKPSTVSTNYTFDGWDTDVASTVVSTDLDIYATYEEETRIYTVKWYNNGTLLDSTTAEYGSSVEYSGETPTDTSGEEFLYYRLFDNWDKNTSFVEPDTPTSNVMTVTALFTEAMVPSADTPLSDMSPTELHALIRSGILAPSGMNNTVIASGDTIDIVMGNDMDFSNVESHELVSLDDPKTFNGNTYYLPTIDGEQIKLFDTDKSFVLAIDFKFADTTSSTMLASCYENTKGFALRYNSGAKLRWGASQEATASSDTRREMVVIRHIAGDNNLYVYASNKMSDTQTIATLTNSLSARNDAPLSFGANYQSDGYVDGFAKGTIFWSKIWMADLGENACKELAAWTRQTVTMKASGTASSSAPLGSTFRLFNRVDNDRYVNCFFLMENLLDQTHVMNSTNTNAGGWKESAMRRWTNARIYKGLPRQWRLLIPLVKVRSTNGSQSTAQSSPAAEDYVFIPSCREVSTSYASTAGYSAESDGTITYFTTDTSRIKKLDNGAGAAQIWWLRSPSTSGSNSFIYVFTSGTVNGIGNAGNSYGVCFGFCI